MTDVFDDEWAARLHHRWHGCDQQGAPRPAVDPAVSAAARLADTASLLATDWSATDESGRSFLAEALRDACDRALKVLAGPLPPGEEA
jgi:hypothetical protein